jgi:hypothetical protein
MALAADTPNSELRDNIAPIAANASGSRVPSSTVPATTLWSGPSEDTNLPANVLLRFIGHHTRNPSEWVFGNPAKPGTSIKSTLSRPNSLVRSLFEVPPSVVSGSASIWAALARVQAAVAQEKLRAEAEVASAIIRAGATTYIVDRTVRALLGERHSRRLEDATDVLVLLGSTVVRELARTALSKSPPDETNEDYWYSLIRAAGHTANAEIVRHFLESQFPALQEAAVHALGDIGGPAAIEDLKRVANDPARFEYVRELAAELVSDLS